MVRTGIGRLLRRWTQAAAVCALLPWAGWAQAERNARVPDSPKVIFDQPDAQRTSQELSGLLERYPPSLESVLALDPSLLGNQAYLAPYPALASFLNTHPEVARNPSFYFRKNPDRNGPPDHATQVLDTWKDVLGNFAALCAFGTAVVLLAWLIRTVIDYKRWNRLTKVQTDVHTKLLDRFIANEDLLAYIQSPAGSKFLESSPITLDAGPRSMGAPLGRILWSVQAGLVLTAAGVGLQVVSARVSVDASQPLHALGVLGIALGIGFVLSAVISFLISRRLGLIEPASPSLQNAPPIARG